MISDIHTRLRPRIWASFVLVLASLLMLARMVYLYLPGGWDWGMSIQPAVLELLHGRSPYETTEFLYPFWVLFPLVPLALVPAKLGTAILFVSGLLAYAYVAYKFEAKPVALLFLLLSFPVMEGLYNGEIEWLAILGLVLPKPVGLFFLLSKPQTGLGVALFWLAESMRQGGWREAIRVFAPISVTVVLSFLLFGPWPLHSIRRINSGLNVSLWPYGIPIGLLLLSVALRHRKLGPAMIASPLLSPYLTPHSWSIVLLGLLPGPTVVIVASIGSWLARILIW
jgi:hypothetical protein